MINNKKLPDGFIQIAGFDPGYGVNTRGEIYSCKTGKLLTNKCLSHNGQIIVGLMDNRFCRYVTVASIMIRTYIASTFNCKSFQVVHLDGDKSNNSIDNLDLRINLKSRK